MTEIKKDIIEKILQTTGITEEQIMSKTRKLEVANAKKMIVWFLYKHTGFSLKQIAKEVGLSDHSSVINCLIKFDNFVKTKDSMIYNDYLYLSSRLEQMYQTTRTYERKKKKEQITSRKKINKYESIISFILDNFSIKKIESKNEYMRGKKVFNVKQVYEYYLNNKQL